MNSVSVATILSLNLESRAVVFYSQEAQLACQQELAAQQRRQTRYRTANAYVKSRGD